MTDQKHSSPVLMSRTVKNGAGMGVPFIDHWCHILRASRWKNIGTIINQYWIYKSSTSKTTSNYDIVLIEVIRYLLRLFNSIMASKPPKFRDLRIHTFLTKFCLLFFNSSKPVLSEKIFVDWPIRNLFSQQKVNTKRLTAHNSLKKRFKLIVFLVLH